MSEALTQAEHSADRMREELLRTLSELDRRRDELTDWKLQAKRHRSGLVVAGAAVAGLVAARVGAGLWLAERERRRLQLERRRALVRMWEHPKQVAAVRRGPKRPRRVYVVGALLVGAFAWQLGKARRR